jgi:hypothetical protein
MPCRRNDFPGGLTMPKCERKRVELEPVENEFLEVIGWFCPIDCEFENCPEHYVDPLQQMSDKEIEAMHDAALAATFPDDTIKTSNCWVFRYNGSKCPGVVERTEETRDAPYGNFCPVCGHSLRYHPELGEGKPKDMAKRWSL